MADKQETATNIAANYGYSVAFFNSDPSLKKLLDDAVRENWIPSQFVSHLMATDWYKKHGEAARQLIALKTQDPATYQQRLNSAHSQILSIAYQVGAGMNQGDVHALAEKAMTLGWTEAQIKQALKPYITTNTSGVYRGSAGQTQLQLRELASQYGYSVSDGQIGKWVRDIAMGAGSVEQVKQVLMGYTASKFPALKDRIMAGETLEDIAAPYKDSYAQILEVNPKTINLRDPKILKALQSKDSKGAPTTQTVWQFEQDLRNDPRWLKTQNAQDHLVGETHKALQSFGLVN